MKPMTVSQAESYSSNTTFLATVGKAEHTLFILNSVVSHQILQALHVSVCLKIDPQLTRFRRNRLERPRLSKSEEGMAR